MPINQIYVDILQAQLRFPRMVDQAGMDFARQLLHKQPQHRLGSSLRGWQEIKDHPFFACAGQGDDTYFDMLKGRKVDVPYVPRVSNIQKPELAQMERELSDNHELA